MGIRFPPENGIKKKVEPTKKEIEVGDDNIKDPISERELLYNSIVLINLVLNQENFIEKDFL